jgi:hypothetical protein
MANPPLPAAPPAATLRLAEDAVVDDVEDVLGLLLDRLVPAGEVVGEHGAVDQLADDVVDAGEGDVADPAAGDEVAEDGEPAGPAGLAVLEVGGLLAVAELGALLDEQLDLLGVVLEEAQVGADGGGDHLQRVGDALDGGIDVGTEAGHALVHGGEEQRLLAGEVQVQRALGHAAGVGDGLHVGGLEAAAGEDLGGGGQDLLAAAGAGFLVHRPPPLSRRVHPSPLRSSDRE